MMSANSPGLQHPSQQLTPLVMVTYDLSYGKNKQLSYCDSSSCKGLMFIGSALMILHNCVCKEKI